MKKLVFLFASLFITVIAVQNVNAQASATETAQTSANIITPIAIQKTVDLVFGNIVPTANPGTVVIATNGNRSFTGGALAFANGNGAPTAAEFNVTGEKDATYSITITNSSFDVTNGSEAMTVNNIVTTPTPTGTLADGTQTIKVGATLNVKANQAPGLYENESSLEITVAYN
ncbi:MAG: DUF4402 domain-containing protein [Prolixibacteraceae bacterium]|nr:DUF4402 domain-containing protein [Prolixibacteraceae bacterium]